MRLFWDGPTHSSILNPEDSSPQHRRTTRLSGQRACSKQNVQGHPKLSKQTGHLYKPQRPRRTSLRGRREENYKRISPPSTTASSLVSLSPPDPTHCGAPISLCGELMCTSTQAGMQKRTKVLSCIVLILWTSVYQTEEKSQLFICNCHGHCPDDERGCTNTRFI